MAKIELNIELIKKLIPNQINLAYVDQNENLEGYELALQNCIHEQSYEQIDIVLDEAYSDSIHSSVKKNMNNLKTSLMAKFNLDKKIVKDYIEQNEDQIEEIIYEKDNSDTLSDLLRNTRRLIAHYDTGYEMSPDSWRWDQKRISKEIDDIKKHLGISKNCKDFDNLMSDMIRNATYGGSLLIYFEINFKDFMFEENKIPKSIVFENFMLGIVDHCNGSGDISGPYKTKIEIKFEPENVFFEKTIKYNWTYSIAGMCSDWTESTKVSFSDSEKKDIPKSKTNEHLERERKLNQTFKNGSCTTGDKDIDRHRDVFYINDFPCGNKCPHCGTFWID